MSRVAPSGLVAAGLLAAGSLAVGCAEPPHPRGEVPPARVVAPVVERGPLVVTHGGQGSPASRSDGPALAAADGLKVLEGGGSALDAAVAAVHRMEDDPRFNAGRGANLRLDGSSIQCDAAIMEDGGKFGAVAGIRGIRHPVDVALAVADTPHRFLSGPGAQAFADTLGLERASLETEQAREKLRRGYTRLFEGADASPWASFDWRRHWNFSTPAPANMDEAIGRLETDPVPAPVVSAGEAVTPPDETKDTVGAVVRTADGRYAAALSTGGTTLALNGRVGDVPQLGAGLFAGEHGAVAATGQGEAITRERVAERVYRLLARGVQPEAAIRRVIRDVSTAEGVGVIAVSDAGYGAVATSQMAWAADGVVGPTDADTVIW